MVLVAEDSEDLREAYVDWFVYKGVRAEQAASGPRRCRRRSNSGRTWWSWTCRCPVSTASRWPAPARWTSARRPCP